MAPCYAPSVSSRLATIARVVAVVLVSAAVGCGFYLALWWVTSEGARRSFSG